MVVASLSSSDCSEVFKEASLRSGTVLTVGVAGFPKGIILRRVILQEKMGCPCWYSSRGLDLILQDCRDSLQVVQVIPPRGNELSSLLKVD